jgi:hypothetical protein
MEKPDRWQRRVDATQDDPSLIWLRRVLITLAMAVVALVSLIAIQPVVVLILSHDTSGGVVYLTNGSSAMIPQGASFRVILSSGGQHNGIRFLCANLPLSEIRGTGYLGGDFLSDILTVNVSGCNLTLTHRLSLP